MGFFGFIGDAFSAVIGDPIASAVEGIGNLVGADPFKQPLKFALTPVRAAVSGVGAVVGAGAAAVGLGAGPPPGLRIVGVPIQATSPAQTFNTPISRGSVSGGAAAFQNFGLSQPGRGNPSWLFSGTSVTSSAGPVLSSGTSQGRWQVSGTSVRRLG